MSTVLNDRDAILQAASVRIINPKNASILLNASSSLFHLNAAGAVDVATITVTATLVGLEGDVTFTADGAALTDVTGKSAVVRYADMQGPAAIVTARIVAGGQTFSQSCIIAVVRDGAPGTSTPGAPGARGAGQYFAGGSAWSDGTANAATPGDNVVSDVVTISNGGTFAMTKRWDGAAWNAIGAVFDGSLFVTESINGAALKAGTVTIFDANGKVLLGAGGEFGATVKVSNLQVGGDLNSLIRDPRFKDLPWWGLNAPANTGVNTGVTPIDWNGTPQTQWRHNVSVYFQSTGGVQYNTQTQKMPLVPGATYLVEYDLFFHDDWDGDFSVWFQVSGWTANLLGGLGIVPDSIYKFFDGNGIQYPGYTRGWKKISTKITVGANIPSATEGTFLFLRSIRGGSVELGGFNLIRLMDGGLIDEGAIEARHVKTKSLTAELINVVNVAAVSATLGDVQLGPNGALHQGTNAYNSGVGIYYGAPGGTPKFFAGTAGGANIRWSPEEGLRVDQASLDTFGAWFTGNAGGGSYPNGSAGYGFLQVNTSGGKAPYTYYWTLTETMRTGNVGRMYMSSQGQSSNTFGGEGSNGTLSYALSCTVVDANQRAITLGTEITVNHGTPI